MPERDGALSETQKNKESISSTPDSVFIQARLLTNTYDPKHVFDTIAPTDLDKYDEPSLAAKLQVLAQSDSDAYTRHKIEAGEQWDVQAWAADTTAKVKKASTFFASEKGKPWIVAMRKIGININTFDEQTALGLYQRYKEPATGIQLFMNDIRSQYTDIEELQTHMDAYTWLAHLFSADVAAISAQAILATKKPKEALIKQAQQMKDGEMIVNTGDPESTRLLTRLHSLHVAKPTPEPQPKVEPTTPLPSRRQAVIPRTAPHIPPAQGSTDRPVVTVRTVSQPVEAATQRSGLKLPVLPATDPVAPSTQPRTVAQPDPRRDLPRPRPDAQPPPAAAKVTAASQAPTRQVPSPQREPIRAPEAVPTTIAPREREPATADSAPVWNARPTTDARAAAAPARVEQPQQQEKSKIERAIGALPEEERTVALRCYLSSLKTIFESLEPAAIRWPRSNAFMSAYGPFRSLTRANIQYGDLSLKDAQLMRQIQAAEVALSLYGIDIDDIVSTIDQFHKIHNDYPNNIDINLDNPDGYQIEVEIASPMDPEQIVRFMLMRSGIQVTEITPTTIDGSSGHLFDVGLEFDPEESTESFRAVLQLIVTHEFHNGIIVDLSQPKRGYSEVLNKSMSGRMRRGLNFLRNITSDFGPVENQLKALFDRHGLNRSKNAAEGIYRDYYERKGMSPDSRLAFFYADGKVGIRLATQPKKIHEPPQSPAPSSRPNVPAPQPTPPTTRVEIPRQQLVSTRPPVETKSNTPPQEQHKPIQPPKYVQFTQDMTPTQRKAAERWNKKEYREVQEKLQRRGMTIDDHPEYKHPELDPTIFESKPIEALKERVSLQNTRIRTICVPGVFIEKERRYKTISQDTVWSPVEDSFEDQNNAAAKLKSERRDLVVFLGLEPPTKPTPDDIDNYGIALIVADGVSICGNPGGTFASQAATREIVQAVYSGRTVQDGIEEAHNLILNYPGVQYVCNKAKEHGYTEQRSQTMAVGNSQDVDVPIEQRFYKQFSPDKAMQDETGICRCQHCKGKLLPPATTLAVAHVRPDGQTTFTGMNNSMALHFNTYGELQEDDTVIERDSPFLGEQVLGEATQKTFQLAEGDYIILMSDGVESALRSSINTASVWGDLQLDDYESDLRFGSGLEILLEKMLKRYPNVDDVYSQIQFIVNRSHEYGKSSAHNGDDMGFIIFQAPKT